MEKIGNQKIWSYCDNREKVRSAAHTTIRAAAGHRVQTYFELAKKVAELQFLNRDHVLLFRGQPADYRTVKGNSMLKASIFRLASNEALYPKDHRDPLLGVAQDVKGILPATE